MGKLTDLELCKRIAEIEGVDVLEDDGDLWTFIKPSFGVVRVICKVYNPLTDKALLLDLILKHEVNTCFAHKECYIIDENAGEFDSGVISANRFGDEQGYPRAILECIVEANNG